MRLEPYIRPELALVVDDCPDTGTLIDRLAERAAGVLGGPAATDLARSMREREERYPTSTPEGVAFPHALVPGIQQTLVIPVLLRPGIRWSNGSHPAQDLVFAIFGDLERPWEHVRLLARLARIIRGPQALWRLRSARDSEALHTVLISEDLTHG